MIKELYVQDIGAVEVGEWKSGYNYFEKEVGEWQGGYNHFEKIEQINETTFAGYRKNKIVQTWNIRYIIRVTYYEEEN